MVTITLLYSLSFLISVVALVEITSHNDYWKFTDTELNWLYFFSVIPFGNLAAITMLTTQWAKNKTNELLEYKQNKGGVDGHD